VSGRLEAQPHAGRDVQDVPHSVHSAKSSKPEQIAADNQFGDY
jgi:hypothetical protein